MKAEMKSSAGGIGYRQHIFMSLAGGLHRRHLNNQRK